jgi:hypothetical protein
MLLRAAAGDADPESEPSRAADFARDCCRTDSLPDRDRSY